MLRKTDNCTEYKNGNITIKYDRDTITEAGKDEVLTISSVLDQIDCYFFGETYCLSNYEPGIAFIMPILIWFMFFRGGCWKN